MIKPAKVVNVSKGKFAYVWHDSRWNKWTVSAKDLTDDVHIRSTTKYDDVVETDGFFAAEKMDELFEKSGDNFRSFSSLRALKNEIGAKKIEVVNL